MPGKGIQYLEVDRKKFLNLKCIIRNEYGMLNMLTYTCMEDDKCGYLYYHGS